MLRHKVKLEVLRLVLAVQETLLYVECQPSHMKTKAAFDVLLGEEEESSDTLNQYFAEKVCSYQGHRSFAVVENE